MQPLPRTLPFKNARNKLLSCVELMSVSFNLNGEFIEFTTKKHNRMDGKYDLPNFIYCNLQNLQMTPETSYT